jgi:hypothetical protein
MKLIEINWKPEDRQLRQFGAMALVGLPLAGWLFSGRPWSEWSQTQINVVGALAAVGAAMAVVGWVRPHLLKYIFLAAMLISLPIGLVLSELILIVIYFGVFTPVALIFRLIGRDALERKIDRQRASYWTPKQQPAGVESYLRQS